MPGPPPLPQPCKLEHVRNAKEKTEVLLLSRELWTHVVARRGHRAGGCGIQGDCFKDYKQEEDAKAVPSRHPPPTTCHATREGLGVGECGVTQKVTILNDARIWKWSGLQSDAHHSVPHRVHAVCKGTLRQVMLRCSHLSAC